MTSKRNLILKMVAFLSLTLMLPSSADTGLLRRGVPAALRAACAAPGGPQTMWSKVRSVCRLKGRTISH